MSPRPVPDSSRVPVPAAMGPASPVARRRFLARIGAAIAAIGSIAALVRSGTPVAATRAAHIHLHDCRIAGSRYYDCRRALPWIEPGDAIELRREPDNRHDQRAVEVYWHGLKLGYIPSADNAVIAGLLDRGQCIRAEVLTIDNDPIEHWEPLSLRLYLEPAP